MASTVLPKAIANPDTIVVSARIDLEATVINQLAVVEAAMIPAEGIARALRAVSAANNDMSVLDADLNSARRFLRNQGYLKGTKAVKNIPVRFAGKSFAAVPWSAYGACARLDHPAFKVHILRATRGNSPNVFIEFGQLSLWSGDWRGTLRDAVKWLYQLGHVQEHVVSRLDIAIHNQILNRSDIDPLKFKGSSRTRRLIRHGRVNTEFAGCMDKVSRRIDDMGAEATPDDLKRVVWEELGGLGKRIEGEDQDSVWFDSYHPQMCSFGGRGGRNLYTRIYYKTREVAYSPEKKAFFKRVWAAAGFDPEEGVINVEFEMCRECLRNKRWVNEHGEVFRINTIEDLIQNYENLVDNLLREQITMLKPNPEDSNRWRWGEDPRWALMREAVEVCVHYTVQSAVESKREYCEKAVFKRMMKVCVSDCLARGEDPREVLVDSPQTLYERICEIVDDQHTRVAHYRQMEMLPFVESIMAEFGYDFGDNLVHQPVPMAN